MTSHENGRVASWTREDGRGFHFGIEAEYLLVDAETFRPLWHPDLTFEELNAAVGLNPDLTQSQGSGQGLIGPRCRQLLGQLLEEGPGVGPGQASVERSAYGGGIRLGDRLKQGLVGL